MIKLNSVSFHYPQSAPVISDISLDIPDGARICLMAPSGSGKTTVLRLLAGLEKPQDGTITGLENLAVSMVFQEDRLIPHKTILQNVSLFCPESLAEKLLISVGLGDCLSSFPEELSGGMKRRAALARALGHPFDLLLLDEPFTGLDEENRQICCDLIQNTVNGKTMVMSSHNADDAAALGAEIINIH